MDVFRCDIKNIVTTAKDYNITVIWDDDLPVIDQTLIVEGKSIAEEGEAKKYVVFVDESTRQTYENNDIVFEIGSVPGLKRYDEKGYMIEYSVVGEKNVVVDANAVEESEDGLTWTYTIHNLPKYAPNGLPYIYSITEVQSAESYYENNGTVVRCAGNANGAIIEMPRIINSFSGECKVSKHWIDGDNKYNLRPKTVTMKLQRSIDDGNTWKDIYEHEKESTNSLEYVLSKREVVEDTKGNTWSYTFTNLPKYDKVDTDNDGEKERVEVKYRWYMGRLFEC